MVVGTTNEIGDSTNPAAYDDKVYLLRKSQMLKRCSPDGEACGPFQQYSDLCIHCWHHKLMSKCDYLRLLHKEVSRRSPKPLINVDKEIMKAEEFLFTHA